MLREDLDRGLNLSYELGAEPRPLTAIPDLRCGDLLKRGLANEDQQPLVAVAQETLRLAPRHGVRIVFGDAVIQNGSMPIRHRHGVGVSGDAVPDLGQELKSVLGREPEDLVSECVGSHGNKLRGRLN